MTTLRKTPALSNNGGVKVNDDAYAEEVNANIVALWSRIACWLNSVGGSANNITASADAPLTGVPTKPMMFVLVPVTPNTSAAFLNIDSQGAIEIRDISGNSLGANALLTTAIYLLLYDGTYYRIISQTPTQANDPSPGAIFAETQSIGTNGGTFTSGAWRIRTLNTTVVNNIAGLTLNAGTNQFTLATAGDYYIEWEAPAYGVSTHVSRLFNVTGNSQVAQSMNGQSSNDQGRSAGQAFVTVSTATAFRIEHWANSTQSSTGFGNAASIGTEETYTTVKIWARP